MRKPIIGTFVPVCLQKSVIKNIPVLLRYQTANFGNVRGRPREPSPGMANTKWFIKKPELVIFSFPGRNAVKQRKKTSPIHL